ncbi:thrombospondin type 1 domain-containing protein [Cyclospora cayetanensis]|uniref:Thrombospondin type 1 domain-containing protein n=1 Tax=Cyclospora cayetanensis TaxID=88456 RepID=A0A1D3D2I6_9EIME|nr:thrombospondin type 1 domain-containing protein [Cyclospora cayetanensis]
MHVHSDILRGKATVRGDGSWVRVDFPTPMKEALVFLGSLDSISDYSLVPQVGEVDKDGFTVRVTVPSCVVTDLSRTHFSVPYLAWKKTSGSNYIAASITLKMTKGLSGYDTYSRTYHLETSIAKNDDYLTLMQIQNMKAVEDGASEFNTTPYVSVKGDVLVDSGEKYSHDLNSPVLAFIQPRDTSTPFAFTVEDSDSATHFVPKLRQGCHTYLTDTSLTASYLLLAYEFENVITWSDTVSGSIWSTEEACGKHNIQVVQVLFSDESIFNGKSTETEACKTQDVTDLMVSFCGEQVTSTSGACKVSMLAFTNASSSTLCPAAPNPSMLMRFNCDATEVPNTDDNGPQCTELANPDPETLEGVVCKSICLQLWESFKDESLASSSPYEAFMTLKNNWHAENLWALPMNINNIAVDCTYERQTTFAKEGTKFSLYNPCPDTYTTEIVAAVYGCESVLLSQGKKAACEVKDVTAVLNSVCSSLNTEDASCTIAEDLLPSKTELCPSCDTFTMMAYYNCRISENTLAGYDIFTHSSSGSLTYSGDIPSCGCVDGSTPATEEEVVAKSSWKAYLTPPATVRLGGARSLFVDKNGKLEFSIWAPSSDTDCLDDDVQVFCKPPLCEEAYSTKVSSGTFQHELCREYCAHLLKNTCASAENKWACVFENSTNCYIPNSTRTTCAIRAVSAEYNPSFNSCGCENDPTMEPCTESEVKMLSVDWTSDFMEHYQGKEGLLLLRNMRVMDGTGSIYTDFGVSQNLACTRASKYKGIFCRVNSEADSVDRAELEPNCDGAVSTDLSNVSDYQCAYSCYKIYNQCREQNDTSIASCYSTAQKDDPTLRQCSVPLVQEDLIEGESNMLTGVVAITTEWIKVAFPSLVFPNPVVLTGLMEPLDTFGQVQITDVSATGFSIRLALDYCRIGYAAAYAKASWLAVSEERYAVSGSGTPFRVGTMDITIDKDMDILPLIQVHSSKPLLLTQIQNIASDLPPTDIPFVTISRLDATLATISVHTTSTAAQQKKFTVGYLYMDQIESTECSTGCKTNNLALETKSATLNKKKKSPVSYSAENFSQAPLMFGSIVPTKTDGKKRMLAQTGSQDGSTKAQWTPKAFVVTNDICSEFVFQEVPSGSSTLRMVALHVQSRETQIRIAFSTGKGNSPVAECEQREIVCLLSCSDITPNCTEAKPKNTAAHDVDCVKECSSLSALCPPPNSWDCFVAAASEKLKADCYIESYIDTGQTVTTSTTVPPIGDTVQCRVVNMEDDEYFADAGWDVNAMSCLCPQGFSPCTQQQVEQDRSYWIEDVTPWSDICRLSYTVQPVAWGFLQVANDLYWSECSATCLPSDSRESTPVRRRRRPQLLPARGNGTPCTLEETVSCASDTLLPCDSLCLHSEWTEWSSCSEKLLEFGVAPVKTSLREKLVSAEAGEACAAQHLKEYDASRCTDGNGQPTSSLPQPSALELGSSEIVDEGGESWSEWSSCDAPCLMNGRKPRRHRLSIKPGANEEGGRVYYSCDDIFPQHDIPGTREYCQEKCREILKSCSDESSLKEQTPLQCFHQNIVQRLTLTGQCHYNPDLDKEMLAPVCFPSLTRMNDDDSSEFRFLDPNSPSAQCLCLEKDAVPCTAAEVFESREYAFPSSDISSCPLQDSAGAMFGPWGSGSADSKLYFAAADSSKIFCPLSNSKNQEQKSDNATYSKFATPAEMNDYCANGLDAQYQYSSSTPYDIDLDCDAVVPRDATASLEDCQSKCRQIQEDCEISTVNFLSCVATKRRITKFDVGCATKGKRLAGRGFVFCKAKQKDCIYSEWGAWSECSATCRSGPGGMAGSVRLRTRQIVAPSTGGGEQCRFLTHKTSSSTTDTGTVELEICTFQKLCDDSDDWSTSSITPKPEPSLEDWSADILSTSTTTTEPRDPGEMICDIVDMATDSRKMGYDKAYRTCKCPSYTRPCLADEAEASRSLWNQTMMVLCKDNKTARIPLASFIAFDCETRTFFDAHADLNESTAETACLTEQYSSVFCVVAEDLESERRQAAITKILILLVGIMLGVAVVLWFIQYSVDVQKGDDSDADRTRYAADYNNGGPQCKFTGTTVIERQCSFICEEIWSKYAAERFMRCADPMSCFTNFWNTTELAKEPQVDSSILIKVETKCSFDGYQEYSAEDLESSAIFGGETLCKNQKELKVVDFVVGHPSAFRGDDWNCLLYSQAEKVAEACQKDRKENNRLYCELGIYDLPNAPELSTICTDVPSNEYRYALFYDCDPPSSSFSCDVKSTTSWDSSKQYCKCPNLDSPCTVEEAKISDSWKDDVASNERVYLADGIRYSAADKAFEAFSTVSNPCKRQKALALCKRDVGPNCYKGTDQPFCQVPCITIWRAFEAKFGVHDTYDQFMSIWKNYDFTRLSFISSSAAERVQACIFEFSTFVKKSSATNTLRLETTCETYEQFSLVNVVSGSSSTLREGKRVTGCAEAALTDAVERLLPAEFVKGSLRTYEASLEGIEPTFDTCSEDEREFFVSWNCARDDSASEDKLPFQCTLYRAQGKQDATHHSCACPNSATPCDMDAALVSRSWREHVSEGATVSLSNYLVFKPSKAGLLSVSLMEELSTPCAEESSYVLCEDMRQDVALDSIPSRMPSCSSAFSTVEGASAADDEECKTQCSQKAGGLCAASANIWLCIARQLHAECYIPNRNSLTCYIESPGPEDASHGTCACSTSSLGACTSLEAEVTHFVWQESLSQFWDGSEGVIVAKNNRALWPSAKASWHYEAGSQAGLCSLAPDCSTAVTTNPQKASTLYCQYYCGHVEWECRVLMIQKPTLYKDIMECFKQLQTESALKYCELDTILLERAQETLYTPRRQSKLDRQATPPLFLPPRFTPPAPAACDPIAAAANMAVSWMVASGTESQVLFAEPIYPPPVVFSGAPQALAGVPKLAISAVTSYSFKVQAFGSICGSSPQAASAELKVVTSYLALPPGQYVAKHSPIRLLVGSLSLTQLGAFQIRIPFAIQHPSKAVILLEPQAATGRFPAVILAASAFNLLELNAQGLQARLSCTEDFASITVGYLIADLSEAGSKSSPLAASLGGRSLALFDSTQVDLAAIPFPENLPTFFTPHFFPQVARVGFDGNEKYSIQWKASADSATWTPSAWMALCGTDELLSLMPHSMLTFTGLYIDAITQMSATSPLSSICNVKAIEDKALTDAECTEMCSGVFQLYCSNSSNPAYCIELHSPKDFLDSCTLPQEDMPSDEAQGETSGKPMEDAETSAQCRVVDMRKYPSDLAWNSAAFTCGCPSHAVPCTSAEAGRDLAWLRDLRSKGGLCEKAPAEVVQPVVQEYWQLSVDACSLESSGNVYLSWIKKTYPAYPDLPGPGTGQESLSGSHLCQYSTPFVFCPAQATGEELDEEKKEEASGSDAALDPPSCYESEWGDWSACSATCVAGDGSTPYRHRTRIPLVADGLNTAVSCILEESMQCLGLLQQCEGSCWTADWSQWSACALVLKDREVIKARRRYKPVFAGAKYCKIDEIQQFLPCESKDEIQEKASEAGSPQFAEVFSLSESTVETSDWSGCDVPVESLEECSSASFDLDCSQATPVHVDSQSGDACVKKCEAVKQACTKLLEKNALESPFKSCVLSELASSEFYLTCKFSGALQTARQVACRPTFTRIIDPSSRYAFLKNTAPDEETSADTGSVEDSRLPVSCACLEDGLEPCSADDIVQDWLNIRNALLGASGLCTTALAQEPLWQRSEESATKAPDSSIFLAFAGLGRFHCPLHTSIKDTTADSQERFTFTQFASTESLNDFCQHGLNYWEGVENPLTYTRMPDCSGAMAKNSEGPEPTEGTVFCQDLCRKLLRACIAEAQEFSYEACLIRPFETPEFADKCTLSPVAAGNGVILCKDPSAESDLLVPATFTTKAPPLLEDWSPESTTTKPPSVDRNSIPADITPQRCTFVNMDAEGATKEYDISTDSCSCPNGYRPCFRGEALLAGQNWQTDAYKLCASLSNGTIGARNFEQYSCVFRGFEKDLTVDAASSVEEKEIFCAKAKYMLCAGIVVAYISLQYSIDLQKLVGLRGRYATISLELQQLREKRDEEESEEALLLNSDDKHTEPDVTPDSVPAYEGDENDSAPVRRNSLRNLQ